MPKKLQKNRQLQKDCEKLWKEIVALRDGNVCMVKKFFPEIVMTHTNVYQADHCISRSNKHLFLEPANGTMICSACNCAKGFKNKSIDRAVDAIVMQREGDDKYREMVEIDMTKTANVNWNKIWWLEEQKERLEEELLKYKKKAAQEDDFPDGLFD